MPPPARKAYALRLDPALFAAIERMAAADVRSVNGEIECLLREAMARRGVKLGPAEPRPRGRPAKETGEAPDEGAREEEDDDDAAQDR